MLFRQPSDLFPGGPGFSIMRTTSQAASEAAAHDPETKPSSVGLDKQGLGSASLDSHAFPKGGFPACGSAENPAGARCHVHVTSGAGSRPVFDVSVYTTGAYSALGGTIPAAAPPPPAAIFTAAKNRLLDGGGSGAWSPLSPNGTGASAQLAQLLGLFDDGAVHPGGALGRSITGTSDYILREFAAAGGLPDLDGDSSLDELENIVGSAHHRSSVPALLPLSTDVSGASSPTRLDGFTPRESLRQGFCSGPLATADNGGGFGSPFMGALQSDSRAFSAGLPSFAGLAAPAGPRIPGLHTLSAPRNALPQGMVPIDQPGSGFMSQPVNLRDAGRAFSMPEPASGAGVPGEHHGHALAPWQPLDEPVRRRGKRSVDLSGVVKRKGSAPDLNMAAMALSEAAPKPKTAPKRATGDKPRKPRRMRCQYCKTHQTPQWRCGPNGPRTLCNACGVRWNKGKLEVNGRPMPVSPITTSGSDVTP